MSGPEIRVAANGRRFSGHHAGVEDRALLCSPYFPRPQVGQGSEATDRSAAEAPAQTAGRETLRGPFRGLRPQGPRRAGYLGANRPSVKLAVVFHAVPVAAGSSAWMPKLARSTDGARPEVKMARVAPVLASASGSAA